MNLLESWHFFSYDLGSLNVDEYLECDVKPVRLAILGLGTVRLNVAPVVKLRLPMSVLVALVLIWICLLR